MVYRGCVVRIEESFAIVLTTGAQYLRVIKKEGLTTGKEILFVEEDLYQEKPSVFKSFGLVAAVMMLLFLSVTAYNTLQHWLPLQQVVAIVSLDINPSLELEVNRENKVLRGVAVNEEGKLLVEPSLKGLAVEDAVLQVVDKAKSLQYITAEKKALLISTVILKEEIELSQSQLEGVIMKKLDEEAVLQEVQLVYVRGKKEDLQKAREEKISIGKYEVFLKATEAKQKVTVEQIKKAKVQELVEQDIGKLKTKDLQKKKLENDKKQEKKQEKKEQTKDISDDREKAPGQAEQDEKRGSNPQKKEDKESLEKLPGNNKSPVEKKNPQKKEPQKDDKKDEGTSSSSESKKDEKKQLKKQDPLGDEKKVEGVKHSKDEASLQRDGQEKAAEPKEQKNSKIKFLRFKNSKK